MLPLTRMWARMLSCKANRFTGSNAGGHTKCATPDTARASPPNNAHRSDSSRFDFMWSTVRGGGREVVQAHEVSYWWNTLWVQRFRFVKRGRPVDGVRLVPPCVPMALRGIDVDRSQSRRGSVGFGR